MMTADMNAATPRATFGIVQTTGGKYEAMGGTVGDWPWVTPTVPTHVINYPSVSYWPCSCACDANKLAARKLLDLALAEKNERAKAAILEALKAVLA